MKGANRYREILLLFEKKIIWGNLIFLAFRPFFYCLIGMVKLTQVTVIVCNLPPSPLSAGRGWTSNQIFKMEGLTGPQLSEWGCWERGGGLFKGGVAIFTHKKELNLKYLITEKVKSKIFFSVITKNSN